MIPLVSFFRNFGKTGKLFCRQHTATSQLGTNGWLCTPERSKVLGRHGDVKPKLNQLLINKNIWTVVKPKPKIILCSICIVLVVALFQSTRIGGNLFYCLNYTYKKPEILFIGILWQLRWFLQSKVILDSRCFLMYRLRPGSQMKISH